MNKILAQAVYWDSTCNKKNIDISVLKSTNILISGINEDYKQPHVNPCQVVLKNKFATNLRKKKICFQSFLDLEIMDNGL